MARVAKSAYPPKGLPIATMRVEAKAQDECDSFFVGTSIVETAHEARLRDNHDVFGGHNAQLRHLGHVIVANKIMLFYALV